MKCTPVCACTFPQIRELAKQYDLPTQARKDSQGICFLGKLKWDDFLRHYLGNDPGEVRELDTGACIGEHNGLYYHTIGQRRGIGSVLNPREVRREPN